MSVARLLDLPGVVPVSADAVLTARGLSRSFGKRLAVADVDLTLSPGRVVGLLGPNGAGKSTLLALLAGHTRPSAGRVIWSDASGAYPVRGRLGMLPQGAPLPPDETPRRFLILLARLQHAADPDAAVAEVLAAVGLSGKADLRMRTLSAGESKLVAIGQAFLGSPQVILLDEPTSALDTRGRQRLRALVRGHRERGAAVVLASHNLSEAEQLCDDVIVLRAGRIALTGRMSELLGALDQARLEIGLAGRLPLDELRAALSTVTVEREAETGALTLLGFRSAAELDRGVTIALQLLNAAGAEVRRVVRGRSLEGALTALADRTDSGIFGRDEVMTSRRHLKLALLAAGAVTLLGGKSEAYDSGTHHGIAAYSWQIMRAASDPQFGEPCRLDQQYAADAAVAGRHLQPVRDRRHPGCLEHLPDQGADRHRQAQHAGRS